MERIEFDILVMLCCISRYLNYHVARFSLAFLWSHVVCSKHPFRAMCCPVNVYGDLKYHVLVSVQLMSYVMNV